MKGSHMRAYAMIIAKRVFTVHGLTVSFKDCKRDIPQLPLAVGNEISQSRF